jgi:hypothetical protein
VRLAGRGWVTAHRNVNRIGADVTVRIVPADEAVAAQSEARDAFVATVESATRLGRVATIAIEPERLAAYWPGAGRSCSRHDGDQPWANNRPAGTG